MAIIMAILVIGSLGLLFGLGLAIASKKFHVAIDPRLEEVFSYLPGVNCGACGNPGCMGFAQALMKEETSLNSCPSLEEEERAKAAGALGISLEDKVKQLAVLHCNGGSKVGDRFQYNGLNDCTAANLILGGQKQCSFGCLGFGTCCEVCPFDALSMSGEGLPVVDVDKCRACGKCVEVCPKGLFSIIMLKKKLWVQVSCKSHALGKDARSACSVACIGCRKCEKECPVDAIDVTDNLAVIDYEKCISCGKCVKVCPMKTIKMTVVKPQAGTKKMA